MIHGNVCFHCHLEIAAVNCCSRAELRKEYEVKDNEMNHFRMSGRKSPVRALSHPIPIQLGKWNWEDPDIQTMFRLVASSRTCGILAAR